MATFYDSLARAATAPEPAALGLITEVRGSSPQKLGAKALFHADGRVDGTLGGERLEAEIHERANIALATGKPETFDLPLDHEDGLSGEGRVTGIILPRIQAAAPIWTELARRQSRRTWGITEDFQIAWTDVPGAPIGGWRYCETITPPCALWIAGAGPIAQAVAPLALDLDFAVTVFDDRQELASYEYFPRRVTLHAGEWEKMLLEPLPVHGTLGLIVTRNHHHDELVLRHWISRDFAFLGMTGSPHQAHTLREHFLAEKIGSEEALVRLACPVGVDIAAHTAPEIAISILAQFIDQRSAYLARQMPAVAPR